MNKTYKFEKSTFVQNLISMRKQRGWSAEQFAEFADIPYPTVRDIEVGKSQGRKQTRQKIAEALGVTIDTLNTPPRQTSGGAKSDMLLTLINLISTFDEEELGSLLNIANGYAGNLPTAASTSKQSKILKKS